MTSAILTCLAVFVLPALLMYRTGHVPPPPDDRDQNGYLP